MTSIVRVLQFLFISWGLVPQAYSSFNYIELPSLTDKSSVNIADYRDKVLLVSFFEPECPWCHRQMKVFNRVLTECSNLLQPLSVGINGSEQKLRPELRRAKVKYAAVKGTPELLKLTGEIPATPWTLIFGPKGQLLGTWQGYLKFEQIQEIFPSLCAIKNKSVSREI